MASNPLLKRRRDYILHDPPKFPQVRRDQIHGAEVLLHEVDKIVERLRSFPRLKEAGVNIGKGALFYGPKGTGKTYFAWHVGTATREFARFIDLRGYPRAIVGRREAALTAEDFRQLIPLANEYVKRFQRPIILFYDEFEKIDNSVIEELRVQLCDIEKSVNGVYFLLTSTDSPDSIDEGLFRPGRINDLVRFDHLTLRGMIEVLRYAFEGYQYDSDIDLETIAFLLEDVEGMDTPAALVQFRDDLYHSVSLEEKTGALHAQKRHFVEQCIRRIAGQPAEETLSDETLRLVAYHEAGHAVLAHLLNLAVRAVSILPELRSSGSHGNTQLAIAKNQIITARTLKNMLAFQFGGMIAEKLFGRHDLMTQEDDLKTMNYSACELVEKFALGSELRKRFGHLILNRSLHEYSDEMRRIIERDRGRMLKRVRNRAWATVKKVGKDYFKACVLKIAEALLDKKILFKKEFNALLEECGLHVS